MLDDDTQTKSVRYANLMRLPPKELHNHFMRMLKAGHHKLEVEAIRNVVHEQRAQRKSERARRKQVERLWKDLLEPLMSERKRVLASLAYEPDKDFSEQSPRTIAFLAYQEVLDTLRNRMQVEKTQGKRTPQAYVKDKHIPNGGEHWTDYVPTHIRQRILALFDDIPHTPKAKRKVPFERVVGVELHNKLKDRLLLRTTKDLLRANQDNLLNPSQEAQELVDKIKHALERIDKLEPTEPVPTTWHGLF